MTYLLITLFAVAVALAFAATAAAAAAAHVDRQLHDLQVPLTSDF